MKQDLISGAYEAESKEDFIGWDILLIEDYKPGVKRVYMRKIHSNGRGTFQIVFSPIEYTNELVLFEPKGYDMGDAQVRMK